MVFNIPVPRAEDLRLEQGLRRDGRYRIDEHTDAVVWRQSTYAPATQQIRFDFVVDHIDSAGVVTRRVHSDMTVRQNSPGEIEHALALSGFQLVDRWGWFDHRPFDAHAPEMVWGAIRKDSWKRPVGGDPAATSVGNSRDAVAQPDEASRGAQPASDQP